MLEQNFLQSPHKIHHTTLHQVLHTLSSQDDAIILRETSDTSLECLTQVLKHRGAKGVSMLPTGGASWS
jgi:hypothetical protein